MYAPPNETRAAPGTEAARRDQPLAKATDRRSRSTISAVVPLAVAYRVAAEANRIEAELRDRECSCPGRAYVAHAWDLGSHKDGCRAGYAWLTVDETRAVLQRLPRRKLAALSLALGGGA
jgi:hypothetical protein